MRRLPLLFAAEFLHAVEYAVGRAPVTAAAGQTAVADRSVATLDPPEGTPPPRGTPERIGRSVVALTGLAMLGHASSLVLRRAAIGRVP